MVILLTQWLQMRVSGRVWDAGFVTEGKGLYMPSPQEDFHVHGRGNPSTVPPEETASTRSGAHPSGKKVKTEILVAEPFLRFSPCLARILNFPKTDLRYTPWRGRDKTNPIADHNLLDRGGLLEEARKELTWTHAVPPRRVLETAVRQERLRHRYNEDYPREDVG